MPIWGWLMIDFARHNHPGRDPGSLAGNAVPELIRDLNSNHRQKAPDQARGCGGAYVC